MNTTEQRQPTRWASASAPLRVAAYCSRATLSRRWAEYLTVVVLIGLLGGLTLGALAGARRTQASYTTYLAGTNPYDVEVFAGFDNPDLGSSVGYDPATVAHLSRLPGVKSVQTVIGVAGNFDAVTGIHSHPVPGEKPVVLEGPLGDEYTGHDRAYIVAGRYANPDNPHEAVMNARAAAEAGLHLGSVVRVTLNSDSQENAMSAPTGPSSLPAVRTLTVTMVGLVVLPQDVDENDYNNLTSGSIDVSRAAAREVADCCSTYSYAYLQLDQGRKDVARVEKEVERLRLPFTRVEGLRTYAPAISAADHAIAPVSVALAAFGGLAALALLVVAVQLISRQLRRHGDEVSSIRALGASTSARVLEAGLGVAAAVSMGAIGAVVVAIALSPLFPLGPVRPVYPVSVAVDWVVMGTGFLLLVVGLCGAVFVLAYRHDRVGRQLDRTALRRPRSLTRRAADAGLPVSAVTGLAFALEPGERDPVPVRSAIFGTTLAIVAVLATVVFGASLNNLVSHPDLYGWNWNYALLSGFAGDEDLPAHQSATLLAHDPYVQAASGVYFAKTRIDGQATGTMGTRPNATVGPPILTGHALRGTDQVVLGTATLEGLGKRVGDTVEVSVSGAPPHRLTIVGTATVPALLGGNGMGDGAVLDYRLIPPSVRNTQGNAVPGPNAYLIRTVGSPALALRSLEQITRTINNKTSPSPGSAGGPVGVLRPEEIVDSHSIVAIPAVLGAGLAAGAALALAATLVASVRRRQRELAILKTLGLSSRQLGSVIAWQSSVTVAIGTVVGVPLGLILGHVVWTGFADAIDAVPVVSIDPLLVVVIALGALVLANIVAAVPARLAARTPTAVLLRAE